MPAVRFYWVDVFADVPLTGNPLSLVVDADALTEEEMRSIAKEFNQSETTFLVAPSAPGADYRLRSFTAAGVEVLGAGHNAMGAWIWLADSGALDAGRQQFAQQIGEDVLPVWIERPGTGRPRVTMRQAAPRFLHRSDRTAEFAAALALPVVSLTGQPGEVVSTGAEHLLLAVKSRQDVDRAAPDAAHLRALLADVGAEGCYLFTTDGGDDRADAYARFFNPTVGIVEDPATGTAAGPLAALLLRDSHATNRTVLILQGQAMGRPSLLTVNVDSEHVDLSGSGLVIGEGSLRL
ncbi:MAG TPA: PhzF family phenazine biosynthesis protein [Microbacterium sp.]|uniref:PhzF family phenazine biosynthesis protein n=1 Tax=Microbacterium sp. TaxID=51671 RepID=UPI002F94742E